MNVIQLCVWMCAQIALLLVTKFNLLFKCDVAQRTDLVRLAPPLLKRHKLFYYTGLRIPFPSSSSTHTPPALVSCLSYFFTPSVLLPLPNFCRFIAFQPLPFHNQNTTPSPSFAGAISIHRPSITRELNRQPLNKKFLPSRIISTF